MENKKIQRLSRRAYSGTGFLLVSKVLIKSLGLVEASVLANYIDKDSYFAKKKENYDNWFFLKNAKQMEELHLTEGAIRKSKTFLIGIGILKTKTKGLPAKEWFKLDYDQLDNCVELGVEISRGLFLELPVGLNNDNKSNDNKDRKKINKKDFSFDCFLRMFPSKWQQDNYFKEALLGFYQDRIDRRNPMSERSCTTAANKLNKYSLETSIETLEAGVERGWSGLFPESIENSKNMMTRGTKENFKVSKYRPQYQYDGGIRYTLNPVDGEYYHKNGQKFIP